VVDRARIRVNANSGITTTRPLVSEKNNSRDPNGSRFQPEVYYPSRQKSLFFEEGQKYLFKTFFSLRQGNIYLFFSFRGAVGFICFFSFGNLFFKLFFCHFSIKSAPFFPRKKRKILISAVISPFRSRFQKFKMEFRALVNYFIYPISSQRILIKFRFLES